MLLKSSLRQKSFGEVITHLLVLGSESPVQLPILWKDRIKLFNIAFPIVFGMLLLLFEVFVILCLIMDITGIPVIEWFA